MGKSPISKEDEEELLQDRSFLSAYLATWKAGFPWKSLVPSMLVCIVLFAYFWIFSPPAWTVAEKFRGLSSIGFGFATSMLGFLVAGFAIFATATKPELFRSLLCSRDAETGFSQLRWVFLTFMHVFFHFICFVFLCAVVFLVGGENDAMDLLLSQSGCAEANLKKYIAYGSLLFFTWWFFYLIVLTGHFVFSVYQTLLVAVVWGDRDDSEVGGK
ncbi:hypothetical protein G3580_07940 [Nitrogeniibacter mangrovi]|uniref:Uncharacterized protein n=1 Tax=Nitrogeniibacter mangrovi TaxID=2016596 RepID=A0A6C1B1T0_9RHOO|nr:hypothetical protein [Nitrogeniibacter mangrovi]QID17582.1 hypothetical protein G3580_07940 [Nitrogeniibacter mangrovi]